MKTALSTEALAKRAGVTFRQLDYWAKEGLIAPSIRDTEGTGYPRRWSEEDVLPVRLIQALLTYSIPQHVVRDALQLLKLGHDYLWATYENCGVGTKKDVILMLGNGVPKVVVDVKALR